jgi:hypothetical protein
MKIEFDQFFVSFKNDYVKRNWLMRGEGILGYFLRLREVVFGFCHRVIGGYAGRWMGEEDEVKFVGREVWDWRFYMKSIR